MSFLLFLLLETSDGDSLHFAAQETTPYTRLDARATVVFGVFLFPFGLFTTVPSYLVHGGHSPDLFVQASFESMLWR